MRIAESCEKCLYDRQVERAKCIADEAIRTAYLQEIKDTLRNRRAEDSAPYMVFLFNRIHERYCGNVSEYPDIKTEFNQLVMGMEADIERVIEQAKDSLEKSIVYARIGNYIDFGAMNHVDKDVFLNMLEKDSIQGLPKTTYQSFCEQCEKATNFLLLCDNCGEIVLDKLFVRQLKKRFPNLQVTAMVRGCEVLNDATLEDAVSCGMDRDARVIANGNGVAGTVIELLSPEARQALEEADVILSKGQGNYESFAGCGKPAFYSFLCKCDLFTSRFGVERYTGMFVEEN